MMNNLKDFLMSIGFGKNEVEVYVSLSELGTASVLEISKTTKIHRSNIYDALRNLVNESLVFEVKGEKKLFYARPVEGLVEYLQQKKLDLQEIIKNFRMDHPQKSTDSVVKLTKGTFGLREAIRSFLETGEDILVYGVPPKAPEVIGPMLDDFHKERASKNIMMKHIYNSDSIERIKYLNKLKFTEARVLPAKYDSDVTTTVSGDKIMFILWGKNNYDVTVLEIKNAELAEPYKRYFEVLWKKAKIV